MTADAKSPSVIGWKETHTVRVRYTNWRGETAWRTIIPYFIRFGATEHHRDEQWLLEAWDVEKGATRTFALKDVREWRANEDAQPVGGRTE